jgi:hypothetical protein
VGFCGWSNSRQLSRIPSAAQRLNQQHTSRHAPRKNIHRRPLILQRDGLRSDHLQVTDNPARILSSRNSQRILSSFNGAILNSRLLLQNTKRRQIILHLLERSEHCLPITRHSGVISRFSQINLRVSPATIK